MDYTLEINQWYYRNRYSILEGLRFLDSDFYSNPNLSISFFYDPPNYCLIIRNRKNNFQCEHMFSESELNSFLEHCDAPYSEDFIDIKLLEYIDGSLFYKLSIIDKGNKLINEL